MKLLSKCSIYFSLLFVLSVSLFADINKTLPDEFFVTERWISWSTTFDIESQTETFGTVHRKIFSLMPEYHLKDADQNLLAKGRMRFFSFMITFDLTDFNDNEIGSVEEKFTFFYPTFTIRAPNGRRLGEASMNFWGTQYTIRDPFDHHPIAVLFRPFFRLKNNWTVQIKDHNAFNKDNIHPHMLLTLIAFQVDYEYWKALEEEIDIDDKPFIFYKSINKTKAIDENVVNSESENEAREFKKRLENYRLLFEGIEPNEKDFQLIELMDNFTDFKEFNIEFSNLLEGLLLCDELTESQKAALFIMLEKRLYNL